MNLKLVAKNCLLSNYLNNLKFTATCALILSNSCPILNCFSSKVTIMKGVNDRAVLDRIRCKNMPWQLLFMQILLPQRRK